MAVFEPDVVSRMGFVLCFAEPQKAAEFRTYNRDGNGKEDFFHGQESLFLPIEYDLFSGFDYFPEFLGTVGTWEFVFRHRPFQEVAERFPSLAHVEFQ